MCIRAQKSTWRTKAEKRIITVAYCHIAKNRAVKWKWNWYQYHKGLMRFVKVLNQKLAFSTWVEPKLVISVETERYQDRASKKKEWKPPPEWVVSPQNKKLSSMIACGMVIAISPFSMVIMIKLKHSNDRPPRSPGVEAMSNHKGFRNSSSKHSRELSEHSWECEWK